MWRMLGHVTLYDEEEGGGDVAFPTDFAEGILHKRELSSICFSSASGKKKNSRADEKQIATQHTYTHTADQCCYTSSERLNSFVVSCRMFVHGRMWVASTVNRTTGKRAVEPGQPHRAGLFDFFS